MINIKNPSRQFAEKLLREDTDIFFAGIIAGEYPGEIWTNDVDDPTFTIVWSQFQEGFNFFGQLEDPIEILRIRSFIETDIIDFLKERNLECFEYSCDMQEWAEEMKHLFADKKILSYDMLYYCHDRVENIFSSTKVNELPQGYVMYNINEKFIEEYIINKKAQNTEIISSFILSCWGSYEKYYNTGDGFAAVYDTEIVSIAMADLCYRRTYDIGVRTVEAHRKKRLASTLANRLIMKLHDSNFDVVWDCMDWNIASQKTAEKIGFKLEYKHKLYVWYLTDTKTQ